MRINVYRTIGDEYDVYNQERVLDGWYESTKAHKWSDVDYNGNGSHGTGRGEAIVRTAGGRWVLETWTRWQDEENDHRFVDDATAKDWLLRNEYDDAVEEFFGELEEETGPGRPEIGPAFTVRLPADLTAQLDERAKADGASRAELIRQAVTQMINA